MEIYQQSGVCAYLPQQTTKMHYFFKNRVTAEELDYLLSRGWRKFGNYYFIDNCEGCWQCIPIRVPVEKFKPSKSQRRVLKLNAGLTVKYAPVSYRDEIYEIYLDHSQNRFGNGGDQEQFVFNFCLPSCPALQAEYYLAGELIAVGYLDVSKEAFSSVYFIYKTAYLHLSLGIFSVLNEIEKASELGLKYYYLGYFVPGNNSMRYKNSFRPNEKMDWQTGQWILGED